MQIRLYLDEDAMDSDLVRALRLHGIDVVTALDLGLTESTDEAHLECAISDGRVLYSFNVGDFMALHANLQTAGKSHPGIILAQATTLQRGRANATIGSPEPNEIG